MSSLLFKYFSYIKSLCRFSNLFQRKLKSILLGFIFCFSAQVYSNVIDLKKIFSSQSIASIQKDAQTDQPSFNVNELGEYGRTLLHDAVESGDVELVKMRIKEGVDVNAQDEEGNTALHYAFFGLNTRYLYSLSNNKFLKIIEVLIGAGADVDLQNETGDTVLHIAIGYGFIELVELLIEAGVNVNLQDERGDTPLIRTLIFATSFASQESVEKTIKVLIKAGANVGLQNEYGDTAFHYAVRASEQLDTDELIELFPYEEIDMDTQDNEGKTALHIAIERGLKGVVRSLIDRGASLDIQDQSGRTALHIAIERGFKKLVEILVEAGASLDIQDQLGRTALHRAIALGFENIALYLIESRATLDIQDNKGRTALHESLLSFRIHFEHAVYNLPVQDHQYATIRFREISIVVVNALIEAGADVNVQDAEGKTALHYIVVSGVHLDSIVELLVENAYIDTQDDLGQTPLLATMLKCQSNLEGLEEFVGVLNENVASMKVPKLYQKEESVRSNKKKTKGTRAVNDLRIHLSRHPDGGNIIALIEAGASVDIQDRNGQTPRSVFQSCYGRDIDDLIQAVKDKTKRNQSDSHNMIGE